MDAHAYTYTQTHIQLHQTGSEVLYGELSSAPLFVCAFDVTPARPLSHRRCAIEVAWVSISSGD